MSDPITIKMQPWDEEFPPKNYEILIGIWQTNDMRTHAESKILYFDGRNLHVVGEPVGTYAATRPDLWGCLP